MHVHVLGGLYADMVKWKWKIMRRNLTRLFEKSWIQKYQKFMKSGFEASHMDAQLETTKS